MSAQKTKAAGHLAAIFTMLIWGTTFISTKVLLEDLSPLEILVLRFVAGYIFLWIIRPVPLKAGSIKAGKSGKYHLSGGRRLCNLLCHLELCSKVLRCYQSQRIYLRDPGCNDFNVDPSSP